MNISVMVDVVHFIKLKSIAESKLGADEEMLELGHRAAWSWVTGQRGNAAPPEASLHGNQASQAFAHVCWWCRGQTTQSFIYKYMHTYMHTSTQE